MVERRGRWSLLLAVAAVLTLLSAACGGGDGDAVASSPPATTIPRSTSMPTTPSTTSTTTTTAPAPTAPPTTVAPAPVSVLVVGDSVAYTLGQGAPEAIPGVTAVTSKSLPGCGLIVSGARPADAIAAGAPPLYDDCAGAVADADAVGLQTDPDVVLLVVGAWERPDHERDGRTVGPDDPAWTEQIRGLLAARVDALAAGGARVAIWVDPCAPEPDGRRRQAWFRDEVVAPVATDRPAAQALDPEAVLCTDGVARTDIEGVGNPRPEDGQHFSAEGAAWLWTTWLGPALAAVGAG